jgi:hypothetical protein
MGGSVVGRGVERRGDAEGTGGTLGAVGETGLGGNLKRGDPPRLDVGLRE